MQTLFACIQVAFIDIAQESNHQAYFLFHCFKPEHS